MHNDYVWMTSDSLSNSFMFYSIGRVCNCDYEMPALAKYDWSYVSLIDYIISSLTPPSHIHDVVFNINEFYQSMSVSVAIICNGMKFYWCNHCLLLLHQWIMRDIDEIYIVTFITLYLLHSLHVKTVFKSAKRDVILSLH